MNSRTCLVCVLAGALLPATAAAQTLDDPRKLERATVTLLRSESPIEGRLMHLAADDVTVMVDGVPVKVPLTTVRRVEVGGDRVGNGAAIGALVVGLYCALICGQGLDSAASLPGFVLRAAGTGALIGAGIDAAHSNRRIIYASPASAAGRQPRSGFVGFTLRF